jgi:hypothetical protein
MIRITSSSRCDEVLVPRLAALKPECAPWAGLCHFPFVAIGDITRESVLEALAEFDEVGRDRFLQTYGFGPSREYILVVEGKEYDSKAIVGAAHRYARPDLDPLPWGDFSGGVGTVVPLLTSLGLVVEARGGGGATARAPRVWVVRAGREGVYEPLALRQSVAVIGWAGLGELSAALSRDELENELRIGLDRSGRAGVEPARTVY